MGQFLGPETDIMGERYFMQPGGVKRKGTKIVTVWDIFRGLSVFQSLDHSLCPYSAKIQDYRS